MRIVLIAHHVAPIRAPFVGGVESFTWYLARWLARRGHDVLMHAPPGSAVPGVRVRELDLQPRLSDAARSDVDMPPEAFMAAHHAYQRVMVELAADPDPCDVVHSNTLHYLPLLMAPTLTVPLLTTLHTPPTPWLESAMRSVAGHTALALSAVSPATLDAWRGIAPVLPVVGNGVDTDSWTAGPGGPGAVWSGRIVPEKAPHLAIDACRAAGLSLRLAGPVIDRAYFDAEVAPRLGDDAVHVGHLDHRELRDLIGESSVALMTPAWDEPFGLAAAEAMACGTPVAAFDRGGLPALVGREGGRIARAGDVDDLARAVREAMRMDRHAVRAHAVRTAGIDAMGHGYERLYGRLVTPRPAIVPAPSTPLRPRTQRRSRVSPRAEVGVRLGTS
jgi:glycosyltransferase involved in cell wall biosynthesis